MTEENLNSSLAIEDVSTPQTVSFNPESDAPPEPPKGRSAIEQSLAEIEKVEGKIPEDPHGEKLVPKDEKTKEEPKAKAEEKPKAERLPNGKFAPKQDLKTDEQAKALDLDSDEPTEAPRVPKGERDITRPPDNFLPRAREKWAEAPEEVKSEFYRALENFEKGKTEYQEDREFRKSVREFEDMAKQANIPFQQAIKNYVELDTLVSSNPVAGVERILANQGIDLVQFAQHVLTQAQQAQANPQQAALNQYQTYAQQLEQQNRQMQEALAQQKQEAERTAMYQEVEQNVITPFKADHPRYDELSEDIVFFLNSGRIPSTLDAQQRLEEAYFLAEQLNPAPNSNTRSAQKQINPAGAKSIKGSLTNGTDVRSDKNQKLNPRDAIQAAMSQLGL